ncbi:LysR family transcriptional regulator [Paenibacillus illinoisensis]|uniref:LysR family transcriptional regulator n=1 Tax=Paenibacillus illinoisensis TaxID=59845 RepID=UPI003CFAE0C6
MEIQQLNYFQVLANMQHVTRAAEHLHLSQPALSRSVAKLEEELGVPLFERHHRSIRLNAYGRIFLVRVERVLKELADSKKELYEITHPERGEVMLGFIHTLGTSRIPKLLGQFRSKFPQIRFQLLQNHSYSLLDQLEDGSLHMCLLAEPRDLDSAIQWRALWKEEVFATLPSCHPLAHAESITLDQLAEEPFILLKEGYALRETADHLFRMYDMQPNITFVGEEVATVAGLVESGLGVSLLPSQQGLDMNNIAQVRLRNVDSHRTIGLAWVSEHYLPPAAAQFRTFVLDNAISNGT